MNLLRSTLFMVWALLVSVVVAPLIVLSAVVTGSRLCYALGYVFRRGIMFGSRWILGIRMKVLGQENMPAEPAVILSKHQSAWETVALQDLIPAGRYAVFVLKKELLKLPFVGWGLGAMRMISIDRNAGRDALAQVVEQGRDRLAKGFYVIVFPEGTRVAPGQKKRYKVGGAHLATHAGCKVVPVAHNAGELWPRNAFIKCSGTVTVSIGPAIDTRGLTDQEVNQRVEDWIETEMQRISPHRYRNAA
ncbi:MAG: lysophospholipid acyltransferase family protein [Betaproteobacteria bacterium]